MAKTGQPVVGADGRRRSPPTERVVAVIDLLRESSGWLSLTEIVAATSTTPPTCLAILRSLVDANWVVRHQRERKYALGPALTSRLVTARRDYWTLVAEDACVTLGSDLGSLCTVGMLSGSEMVTLYDWRPADVRFPSMNGVRMPFAAPLGAALATVLPADDQRAWLQRGEQSDPTQDTRRLKSVLAGIRERGFNVHHHHPDGERFARMLTSRMNDLHYPTVRTLLALTEQPLDPKEFRRLGSLPIGTVSAAVVARHSALAVNVAVACAGQVLTRQRCFEIGAKVQQAVARIGEALDEPTQAFAKGNGL
jgi:DNA-binding IclR family transcriptional regulator